MNISKLALQVVGHSLIATATYRERCRSNVGSAWLVASGGYGVAVTLQGYKELGVWGYTKSLKRQLKDSVSACVQATILTGCVEAVYQANKANAEELNKNLPKTESDVLNAVLKTGN